MTTVPVDSDGQQDWASSGSFTRLKDTTRRRPFDHTVQGWVVKAYPECGEASIGYRQEPPDESAEPTTGGRWASMSDDDRAQANWERANRRAVSESRRYMVRNGLRFMWVLTFAGSGLHGPEGRALCMRYVAAFVRRVRAQLGEDYPYWASPELHPGGHGWHVNFFMDRWMQHALMAELWGHGYVHVTDFGKRRNGRSRRQRLRAAATYGCKYASKDWAPEVLVKNARRFTAAEGYSPSMVGRSVTSRWAGYCELVALAGGEVPAVHLRSEDCETYEGPPWDWLCWP